MKIGLLNVEVRREEDVVSTRQRARQIAGLLGFSDQEQTALATAVSEIARNAFRYAGGGRVEFAVEGEVPHLLVRVNDRGPGIADLERVLSGQYVSATGMGLGVIGSRRLCDRFDIESSPAGTSVTLGRRLPRQAPALTPQSVAALSSELARQGPRTPLDEVRQQNRELLQAMEALRARQAEVERLNAELAETNRGVLALYAELDERAESLRVASELKSRFLSDMSHELRTPLNAMISLTGLLLDRTDGELTAEQEKQVGFIRGSAQSLGEMVNDLLDLAKIEAGKVELRPAEFHVEDVLAALRGMFRPLLPPDGRVALHVEEPTGVLTIFSDEGKVSQILRNFISNALKFTERGEVRVRAEAGPAAGEAGPAGGEAGPAGGDTGSAAGTIVFSVSDTGIGIDPADLERIFEEFAQVDNPMQRRARGTGLGLPLTRKLAELLGGTVSVRSRPGVGSTFTVTLPVVCPRPGQTPRAPAGGDGAGAGGATAGGRPHA